MEPFQGWFLHNVAAQGFRQANHDQRGLLVASIELENWVGRLASLHRERLHGRVSASVASHGTISPKHKRNAQARDHCRVRRSGITSARVSIPPPDRGNEQKTSPAGRGRG